MPAASCILVSEDVCWVSACVMSGIGRRPRICSMTVLSRLPYDDLKRLIAELPDGYRTVFNLYCIEELSHREIAERLGISEKTSSSQLFRAKALLARRIKEYVKDK